MIHRKIDVSRLMTPRITGVQKSAEFVLKCTAETDQIETDS